MVAGRRAIPFHLFSAECQASTTLVFASSEPHSCEAVPMRIQLAQRTEADDLLGRSPLALLVGMLLDQQIPMEWAFTGPHTISERLGHDLTAEEIAARDPEEFAALLAAKPAVHRYPKAM